MGLGLPATQSSLACPSSLCAGPSQSRRWSKEDWGGWMPAAAGGHSPAQDAVQWARLTLEELRRGSGLSVLCSLDTGP